MSTVTLSRRLLVVSIGAGCLYLNTRQLWANGLSNPLASAAVLLVSCLDMAACASVVALWPLPPARVPKRPVLVDGHDVRGGVVGYRSWRVSRDDGEYCLWSSMQSIWWPTGQPMTAAARILGEEARSPDWPLSLTEAMTELTLPDVLNTYGVYAWNRVVMPFVYGIYGDQRGEVYLWGRVVEHEEGYRAQFAYPKRFIGGAHGRALATIYGVPYISWTRWVIERCSDGAWQGYEGLRRLAFPD